MKKIILFILITLGFNSQSKSQTGWFSLSNPAIQPYFGVSFINANTGFVCGAEGLILKTTNGGTSWDTTILNTNPLLYKILFISSNIGFATSAYGQIWRTKDGGDDWESLTPTIGGVLIYDITFIDQSIGIAVGRKGVALDTALIMRTNNGGDTWENFQTPFVPELRGVSFYNDFDGFAVGTGNLRIRSINSGQNWSQTTASPDALFFDVAATSSTNVYAVGPGGVYLSTSAGNSWSSLYNTGYTNTILFLNATTGFCGGRDGNIWRTTNSGNLWINQHAEITEEFMDISFVDDNTGYAVGNSNNEGIIYKTTTGGVTVNIQNISSQIADNYFLYQNYPNPFNPQTKIKFKIPELSDILFSVYDVRGIEVYSESMKNAGSGTYEVTFDSDKLNLSSGIYFYKLNANKFQRTMKMVLLK